MTNQLIKLECKLQREDDKSYLSMPYRGEEDHAYALPSDPNCRSAQVPQGVENANGQGYIELPVFDSITKFMMSPKGANKRIVLYTYLNDQLHSGNLSRIVGVRILNRVINKEVCEFTEFRYWEMSRNEFVADITVQLKLQTRYGDYVWKGVLVCWCGFADDFHIIVDDLVESTENERKGYVALDPFLIQVYKGYEIDNETEKIWMRYKLVDALNNPKARKAKILAEAMKLRVIRLPIYDHKGLNSILFFEEGTIQVGVDKMKRDDDGRTFVFKDDHGEPMEIPANTIVINANRVEKGYEDFAIFHECYHYEKHYLAFRLQRLTCSDTRTIQKKSIPITPGMQHKDHLLLMENQADRGASALWMPVSDTRRRIVEKLQQVKQYRHSGELFEQIGISVATQLSMPYFRIRCRMIQLGYIEAKGVMHFVAHKHIRPFAFDPDSLRAEELTFLITPTKIRNLCKESEEFRALINSNRYVYAEGHLVYNDPKFVSRYGKIYVLTDLAIANVDICCLRFVRVYVQKNLGRYVLGRMYMDAEYVERTMFYLGDALKQPNLNNFRAKGAYIDSFPTVFKEAVDLLKSQNKGISNAAIAEALHMTEATFQRALSDPKKYKNEDFVMVLCLYFKLPDWISELLFKRVHVMLDPDDERHAAMLEILRSRSCDGVDAAQEFMKECGVDPLNWA